MARTNEKLFIALVLFVTLSNAVAGSLESGPSKASEILRGATSGGSGSSGGSGAGASPTGQATGSTRAKVNDILSGRSGEGGGSSGGARVGSESAATRERTQSKVNEILDGRKSGSYTEQDAHEGRFIGSDSVREQVKSKTLETLENKGESSRHSEHRVESRSGESRGLSRTAVSRTRGK